VLRTKSDLVPEEDRGPGIVAPDSWGEFHVSSVSGEGLDHTIEALWKRVREEKARLEATGTDPFEGVEEWRP
jgi:hypothetical protein